jgi:hypothetical protein
MKTIQLLSYLPEDVPTKTSHHTTGRMLSKVVMGTKC